MPEESVAAYINNIITFLIFIIVIAFIFLVFFIISGLYRSSLSSNNNKPGAGFRKWLVLRKDPFLKKNLFITGITFILTDLFILLVLAAMDYSKKISLNILLVTIGFAVFFILVMLVYIVRSKIIR